MELPLEGDESGWATLAVQVLEPRQLHLASGITRWYLNGSCPPRIRIRKLDEKEMDALICKKKLGNQAFTEKNYSKAIEHYEDALLLVDIFFVAPTVQVDEIINCLSNQAECHLRLGQNKEAGDAATAALMFDQFHQKSRFRRAKAELAIGTFSYLVQAQADLEEIIREEETMDVAKEV